MRLGKWINEYTNVDGDANVGEPHQMPMPIWQKVWYKLFYGHMYVFCDFSEIFEISKCLILIGSYNIPYLSEI